MESLHHSDNPLSLTPPIPSISVINHTFHAYETGKENDRLKKLKGSKALLAQIAFVQAVNSNFLETQHVDVMETTFEKRQMEQAAREFVSSTVGVAPIGNVYWQPNETFDKLWGSHNLINGVTYVADQEHASRDLKYMHEMSSLVHEFAHETGDDHHLSALYSEPDEVGNTSIGINPHGGMTITAHGKKQSPTVKVNFSKKDLPKKRQVDGVKVIQR